ncbi:MAG: hypothetical protein ACXABY_13075 [Candidatus Thorarchaeota archaeon]
MPLKTNRKEDDAMITLTTFQCPQCFKVYITKIVIRQTITGGRPTLQYPYRTCNGLVSEGEECGFNFEALQVESFDIPIQVAPQGLITKPGG